MSNRRQTKQRGLLTVDQIKQSDREEYKVEDIAHLIGLAPGRVRGQMLIDYKKKTQRLPIGRVHPSLGEGRRFSYHIYKGMLLKYLGE